MPRRLKSLFSPKSNESCELGEFLVALFAYSLNFTNNFPCCLFAIFSICAPSFAFIILQEEEMTKKKGF